MNCAGISKRILYSLFHGLGNGKHSLNIEEWCFNKSRKVGLGKFLASVYMSANMQLFTLSVSEIYRQNGQTGFI